jgi:ELWxxDGT repeat protein
MRAEYPAPGMREANRQLLFPLPSTTFKNPFPSKPKNPMKRIILSLLIAIALVAIGHAQQLVKDINTAPDAFKSLHPRELVTAGGTTFFVADNELGTELWKTDGTPTGTVMVKDIRPGVSSANPESLTACGNLLFFVAFTADDGKELWKSDGTTEGTTMVKDIFAGPNPSAPQRLTDNNGVLLFLADDGIHGLELWRSNGNPQGTTMLVDLAPGGPSTSFGALIAHNNEVFFTATEGLHGRELWVSDGTPTGTRLVKDIVPGAGSSNPELLGSFRGKLYFGANDLTHGSELWSTDGTTANTNMVVDLSPGPGNTSPGTFTNMGSYFHFYALSALWKSDGTPGGTTAIKNTNSISRALNVNGKYFFFDGRSLFTSDGSPAGTIYLKDTGAPGTVTSLNGVLYFSANFLSSVIPLWRSDGTPDGTQTIFPNVGGAIGNLTTIGPRLVFAGATETGGFALWKSSGQPDDYELVFDNPLATGASNPFQFTAFNNKNYFVANDGIHGRGLWVSDGTAEGTTMVYDFDPGEFGGSLDLMPMTNKLIVVANDVELFAIDAQSETPEPLATILSSTIRKDGASKFAPGKKWLQIGDILFFAARGDQLWRTDGTPAGTMLVKRITGSKAGIAIDYMARFNDELFFRAGETSASLWKSDGTEAGTVVVKEDVAPLALTVYNDALYFAGQDPTTGVELWKSDGTSEGTVMVTDVDGGSLSPDYLTVHDEMLYFTSQFGTPEAAGLWTTDGTAEGSRMIMPLSGARELRNVDNTLFFTANSNGQATLWRSNGSTSGTIPFTDAGGQELPGIGNLTDFNNYLYFTSTQESGVSNLWKTNGRSCGTHELLADSHLTITDMLPAGNTMFLSASEYSTGAELFKYNLANDPSSTCLPQEITFAQLPAKVIGDESFELIATSSAGLPVAFKSSNPSIASVDGNSATILAAGQTIITAYQNGDDTYLAAHVSWPLVVSLEPDLTFDPIPDKTYGDAPFFLTATTNSSSAVTFTSADPSIASLQGNEVTIHGAGEVAITASLEGEGNPVQQIQTLTISKALLKATANSAERSYGEPNPEFTILYEGLRYDDTQADIARPAITCAATPSSDVGPYDITLSPAQDPNYEFSSLQSGTLTINKALLTATADDKTKTYGALNPPLTISYAGFKGTDDETTLDTPPLASTEVNQMTIPGSYAIALSEASDMNYDVNLVDGVMTVTGTVPEAFVISPADNAMNQNSSLTVEVQVVAGAATYTIELNTSPDFNGTAIVQTSGRNQKFAGLAYNTRYFTRVKTNLSPLWGFVTSFTTAPAEYFSYVISPTDGAVDQKLSLKVMSNLVSSATQYTIELNTSADFSGVSLSTSGAPVQDFSGLTYGTTYFVRVRTDLTSAWGKTTTFRTAEFTGNPPQVKSPKDGSRNVSTDVTVSTSTVKDAIVYTVELNTTPDFTGTSLVQSGERKFVFTGLAGSTTYYTRVKADVFPFWGSVTSFTTEATDRLLAIARTTSSPEQISFIPQGETEGIQAHPNPFRGVLNVTVFHTEDASIHVALHDITGKLVHESVETTNTAFTIDKPLPQGFYLLMVRQGLVTRVVKLLRERE